MSEEFKRKLTAILSADVVGYSRLMFDNEEETVRTLKSYRKVIESLIVKFSGRLVDNPGDNLLAEFASVVEALRCAWDIQQEIKSRNVKLAENRKMTFRIGVNLGDVIEEDGRIYGDGVNVSARLESLADAGGICISANVYNHVKNKLPFKYEDQGVQSVKNIDEPIQVYRVVMESRAASQKASTIDEDFRIEGFGGAPAIAVLPFDNLSKDSDQEYFADGIAEDLITRLSSWRSFPVIARNSSFTYKGRAVNVKQVSQELGVRYLVEGSVRKSGEQLRISAQLIDAKTGAHIWADRYDRKLADIFAIQDEITIAIAAAMGAKLNIVEGQRLANFQSKDLNAYDMWMRGIWINIHQAYIDGKWNEKIPESRSLLEKAIKIDQNFARAYVGLAFTYVFEWWASEVSEKSFEILNKAEQFARKSVILDPQLADAHLVMGHVHMLRKERSEMLSSLYRAIEIDPCLSDAHRQLGFSLAESNQPEEAISVIDKGIQLSPCDPLLFDFYRAKSHAYFAAGKYETAIQWAKRSIQQGGNNYLNFIILAASQSHNGQIEDAGIAIKKAEDSAPMKLTLTQIQRSLHFIETDFLERLINGLRKVGLPE